MSGLKRHLTSSLVILYLSSAFCLIHHNSTSQVHNFVRKKKEGFFYVFFEY